jgi:hypothetical protein
MNKIWFFSLILFLSLSAEAQISDVKRKGDDLYLYKNGRSESYATVRLMCSKCDLGGFNEKFVVVDQGDESNFTIYNANGSHRAYIRVIGTSRLKSVTSSFIIIEKYKAGTTNYYDFNGNLVKSN